MTNTTETPTPTPVTPVPQHPPATLTRGIIIGLLVVVLALLLCALYIWGAVLSRNIEAPVVFTPPATNKEPETPRADADVQLLQTMSSSDELPSIEADLESTNLDMLDQELPLIENDLRE